MKYSNLFGKTIGTLPESHHSVSYSLLLKGGFLKTLGAGLITMLPLGNKVRHYLKSFMISEMDTLGGQRISIPFITPYDIWKKSGRADLLDRELVKFRDRTGRQLVLSPTHEEAVSEVVKDTLRSYSELPLFLYQFQNKFRDEARAKCGLWRSKEFIMMDGYSFHKNFSDLNNFFPKVYASYQKIFEYFGINVIAAESSFGNSIGVKAYEFLMPLEFGDDSVITCSSCKYQANTSVAKAIKSYSSENPLPLEKVSTKECSSIEDVKQFFGVEANKVIKTVIFKTLNGYIMAVVRSDYGISIEKLSILLAVKVLRPASAVELEVLGFNPNAISPLDFDRDMPVVIDDAVVNSSNLIIGGKEEGYHYRNANFGRDFDSKYVGDIIKVNSGDLCIQCGTSLEKIKVMEIANIFKLGDYYSKAMDLFYFNKNGEKIYPSMGSYGMGMERLIAGVVEANNDEKGIIWPNTVSPYTAYLMGIGKSLAVKKAVQDLHGQHEKEILCDDRSLSPGVKLKDADLLGFPIRIIVSPDGLENKRVEIYHRRTGKIWHIDISKVGKIIESLRKSDKAPWDIV